MSSGDFLTALVARLQAGRLRDCGLGLIALVLGWFLFVRRLPVSGGDTWPLASSSRELVRCASAGTWLSCPGVARFGLQQHLVGMFFAWEGGNDTTIVTSLARVSFLAFVLLVVMLMRSSEVPMPARRLALLALVLGPTLVYSIYSLGESLSVAVNGALVLVLWRRGSPWLVGALAAYACTSKETAVFSVLLIGFAVLVALDVRQTAKSDRGRPGEVDRPRRWAVDRRGALGLVVGCISGLIVDALFNVWRYGEIGNRFYDSASFRTPGVWLKIKSAAAIWVSPGGGAFTYWFLGAALATSLPLLALFSRDRRRIAAGTLVLLALILQTAGLSAWYAPFGWYAWGPRLLLPTLAMAVVAVVAAFGPELVKASGWLGRHRPMIIVLVSLSLISAAANLGFLVNPAATLHWFYTPHTASCPRFPDFVNNRDHYYACVDGLMTWRLRGSLWTSGASRIRSGDGLLLISCALIAVAALVKWPTTKSPTRPLEAPPD